VVVFESLIKPKEPIPEAATNIHGITNEMVEHSPTWEDKWPEVAKILENRFVLIYNASYDEGVIYNSCNQFGIKPISFNTGCIMEVYRMFCGLDKWVNLSEASGIWSSHRAVDDCQAALKVVAGIWESLGLLQQEVTA
jgi:DNA polymerase-3 subunit epsilon